jgi:hypothetical protein
LHRFDLASANWQTWTTHKNRSPWHRSPMMFYRATMLAKRSKSRKRSVANFPSMPPDPPVFFLDQCLGRNVVAGALRAVGEHVEVLTDHFDPATQDSEWLRAVGRRGWIILTKDRHIRSNQIEIVELMASGAPCFTLTSANATGEDMARAFVTAMPVIKRFMEKFSPPFVATVSLSGAVSMLHTHSALIKRVE